MFVRNALHSNDTLYAYAATRADADRLTGRGIHYRIHTPRGDWVVRRYRRGGAIAPLLGDKYVRLGAPRPWRELQLSELARGRGISSPRIAAAVLYARGLFFRADLATEYVPDSEDLAQLAYGESKRDRAAKLAAFRAAGRLVRQLGEAGIAHPDLNLKNILISFGDSPRAWVLDLDRGRATVPNRGESMWRRLQRSIAKWQRSTGKSFESDFARELEAGFRG